MSDSVDNLTVQKLLLQGVHRDTRITQTGI